MKIQEKKLLGIGLLTLLFFTHCAWDKYATYSTERVPHGKLAIVYAPEDNMQIIKIDGRNVADFHWDENQLNHCILEFLPGLHTLSMIHYAKKRDLVGDAAHSQNMIQVKSFFNPGHIYLLSPIESGDAWSAHIEDVTANPKIRSIIASNYKDETDQPNADAFMLRGLAYISGEMWQQAIADFNAVIELDPSRAEAYILRGAARSRFGKQEDAELDIRRAADLGLNKTEYINQKLEEADGNPKHSQTIIRDTLKLFPDENRLQQALSKLEEKP